MLAPKLVVALDVPDPDRAATLVDMLAPLGVLFKLGYEAFYGYREPIEAVLAAAERATRSISSCTTSRAPCTPRCGRWCGRGCGS